MSEESGDLSSLWLRPETPIWIPLSSDSVATTEVSPKKGMFKANTPNKAKCNTPVQSIKFDPNTYTVELTQSKSLSRIRNSGQLHQRLCNSKQQVLAKVDAKRKQLLKEEVKECTFTPKTRHNKAPLRTNQQFFQDMLKFQAKKEGRRKQLTEALKEPECSFTPKLCEVSREIAHTSLLTRGDTTERLAKVKATQSSDCLPSFSPKVLPRSKELLRSQNVSDLLYADALRRRNYPPTSPKSSEFPKPATTRSNSLLSDKFLQELGHVWQTLESESALNYSKFMLLLEKLGFVRGIVTPDQSTRVVELWEIVNNAGPSLETIKVVMMGVMGFYSPWMSQGESNTFTMTRQETKDFHQKYWSLYELRHHHAKPPRPQPRGGPQKNPLPSKKLRRSFTQAALPRKNLTPTSTVEPSPLKTSM